MTDKGKLYAKAMLKYGFKSQATTLIEKCAELQYATCKVIKKFDKTHKPFDGKEGLVNALAEEIADVRIMTEQLEHFFGIKPEVGQHTMNKLKKLEMLLQDGVSP